MLAVTQGITGIQKVVLFSCFLFQSHTNLIRTELWAGMYSFLSFFLFWCEVHNLMIIYFRLRKNSGKYANEVSLPLSLVTWLCIQMQMGNRWKVALVTKAVFCGLKGMSFFQEMKSCRRERLHCGSWDELPLNWIVEVSVSLLNLVSKNIPGTRKFFILTYLKLYSMVRFQRWKSRIMLYMCIALGRDKQPWYQGEGEQMFGFVCILLG